MRWAVVVVALLLTACSATKGGSPGTFALGQAPQLDIGVAAVAEIPFPHPMNPDSVRSHLDAPGQVRQLTPTLLVLDLTDVSDLEVHAIIKAGTQDQAGLILASDWVVAIHRRHPGPFELEKVWGGFRLGPFTEVVNVKWVGADRVYGEFRRQLGATLGIVSLTSGGFDSLATKPDGVYEASQPVLGGKAVLFTDGISSLRLQRPGEKARTVAEGLYWQSTADGTRFVSYQKGGSGYVVDLVTGAGHRLDAPGFRGSNILDSWSPDGSHYLIQGSRNSEVPGFYIADSQAQVIKAFTEPGYFSMWATWSPYSRTVAFLAQPIGSDALPPLTGPLDFSLIATRLGVLDVASGKARYFTVDGQFAGCVPVWSADGSRLAIWFGRLQNDRGVVAVRGGSLYFVDLATGSVRPLGEPFASDEVVTPMEWSQDNRKLLVKVSQQTGAYTNYVLLDSEGRVTKLAGPATWIDSGHLVVIDRSSSPNVKDALTLVGVEGNRLRTLATGSNITSVIASLGHGYVSFSSGESDQVYLTIVRIE